MSRRGLLRVAVKLGLLGIVAAFAALFARGLLGPGPLTADRVIEPAGIPAGAARLESWNGRPVWIVHRSASQLRALSGRSEVVQSPAAGQRPEIDNPHRSRQARYGVYLAETDRSGVLLRYLRERPDRLDPAMPWHGGFVDPGSGALFDSAGRRYRSTRGAPLPVPPHRFAADGSLVLGRW
ncbi:MAG TPA: hypothetical protein VK973_11485 [Arenicellales bacterium]|nr:hypothetical protein [Arenicellales bacterium]